MDGPQLLSAARRHDRAAPALGTDGQEERKSEMKVSEEWSLDDEESTYYCMTLVMDDGTRLDFRDMCQEPEDNSYWRDHRDIPNLVEYIKAAYDAGRRGETFEIEML